jgi:hypothetical protein
MGMREIRMYSASCPMCGYEHDFPTKRAMETDWASWTRPLEKAMSQLSIALTERDKEILRASVGIPNEVAAMRGP